MARIELARQVRQDFDRFIDHMKQLAVPDPEVRFDQILRAIQILTFSPLIGRPVGKGRRELVIGLRS